jgi:hypothetical protein
MGGNAASEARLATLFRLRADIHFKAGIWMHVLTRGPAQVAGQPWIVRPEAAVVTQHRNPAVRNVIDS